MAYRAKKNKKDNVRVKLHLTKKLDNLITSASKITQNIELVEFSYVNCKPKIKSSGDSVDNAFFHSLNGFNFPFSFDFSVLL